jgi:hypothetical protein
MTDFWLWVLPAVLVVIAGVSAWLVSNDCWKVLWSVLCVAVVIFVIRTILH